VILAEGGQTLRCRIPRIPSARMIFVQHMERSESEEVEGVQRKEYQFELGAVNVPSEEWISACATN
jgi:hypothetical protein